jgi:hypothetical protein
MKERILWRRKEKPLETESKQQVSIEIKPRYQSKEKIAEGPWRRERRMKARRTVKRQKKPLNIRRGYLESKRKS